MSTHHNDRNPTDAGEAGYRGSDRQPINRESSEQVGNPDPAQAATKGEVHARSHKAIDAQKQRPQSVDPNHTGPVRDEHQKSHGDAHHDGNEMEKDMQGKVERI